MERLIMWTRGEQNQQQSTSTTSSSTSNMIATSPAVAPDGSGGPSETTANATIDIATAAQHSLVSPLIQVVETTTPSNVASVFGQTGSPNDNPNDNVNPVSHEEFNAPAVAAAAASMLLPELPESLTTIPAENEQVSSTTTADAIDTTSAVSTPAMPILHNTTNEFAQAVYRKHYHKAHDDHIPLIPSFVPHLGSHHHVHRHHVLKNHITKKKYEEENVEVEEVEDEVAEVNTFHDLLAGGIAGSASVVVGHPFDTIKVRMQTGGSMGGAGGSLMSPSAIKGLFRGMAPPLGAAGLVNALVFGSYGWSNRMWDSYYGTEEEEKTNVNEQQEEAGFKFNWKAYWCGCFAGLTQTFLLAPTEHIKCRLQVQSSLYNGPRDAASKILKSHGIGGLYRGFTITAMREVPAFGLYFTSYDYLKENISKQLAKRDMDQPWIASGISGGVSGCLTWLVVYPTDVIKSRIQTQSLDCKKGIISTGKEIYSKGGIRLLFRGLGVTLVRAFPVNSVIFPVYEFCILQLTGGDQMLD